MFKTRLKDSWSQLASVIRAHYALENNQCFKMQGKLTVKTCFVFGYSGYFNVIKNEPVKRSK